MSLTLRPIALAAMALVALSGCAPLVPQLPAPLPVASLATDAAPSRDGAGRDQTRVAGGPKVPEVEGPKLAVTAPVPQSRDEVVAAVNLAQVALPTFIQVVYADVLKKNVSVDPAVIARTDLVTFKAGAGLDRVHLEPADVKRLHQRSGCTHAVISPSVQPGMPRRLRRPRPRDGTRLVRVRRSSSVSHPRSRAADRRRNSTFAVANASPPARCRA